MKTIMYTIYDSKAQVYNKPFYMVNEQVAVRSFRDLANDPSSDVCKHPEDFTLWRVGEFEDTLNEITLSAPPVVVCKAIELKEV